ncbi:hydrolase KNAG_0E03600 [Huiozyma naganishii CBS 8797]|uniref:Glycoside hydrolase family 5 C-terminal domain-containing protein n=1 Tax=Huiozyma naganishii (strain ATCC MYA-139 / BCRC 22969 / CBS 8797 / KCTC 17520 / NBRC 10181 / NCYC 3082 / Yp74L-3) TaxID=1071383 RepID=J7RZH9_HUIN7|nr:hypothetical protein KNAG_0E03600 [Kazachstania naganishii CBS 8797]CCK70617.1 hypothetical protein KNAG_0E03600 [Kazachstania naganishii CBS 8797]
MMDRISISKRGEFCDAKGRVFALRGVNLDPSVKFPASPYLTTHAPIGRTEDSPFYTEADKVSFIGHPLPLDEVEVHVNRIKSLGFNAVRVLFTWEALEHEGPGVYDYEYMDYMVALLKKIHAVGGVYVYLDPHQDVWSRFCGGSGAPLWTLLCCGFDPTKFKATEAALLHNDYIDPKSGKENGPYMKMLWATNYFRLASQTMFTLFFAGELFAPKCVVNGVNIQEYLQGKFCDAVMTLYARVRERAPELFTENCVIGLESINEPNFGYIGQTSLGSIPKERKLKLGSTPTPFASFKLGEGIGTTVQCFELSTFGPSKTQSQEIKPSGVSCWLTAEERDIVDKKYGWEHGDEWTAGQCIWRLHGVWSRKGPQGSCTLLKPNYFSELPGNGSHGTAKVDKGYFINRIFMDHYKRFHSAFRAVDKDSLIFLQPPVLEEPPLAKGSSVIDDRTVYALHFYDGFSLMFKTWNQLYNVDTVGIVRGKYSLPVTSLVFGEENIRKSIRNQLQTMRDEVAANVGANVGVLFSEIGMPFDMNAKKSYRAGGNYSAQTRALDAIMYALEGTNLSFSLWCYCHRNNHEWGDEWNNEDFSIWSPDDVSREDTGPKVEYRGESKFIRVIEDAEPDVESDAPLLRSYCPVTALDHAGIRAVGALLRPFPLRVQGSLEYAEFKWVGSLPQYGLRVHGAGGRDNHTSYIFLPQYHFPLGGVSIRASSGRFEYYRERQVLKWCDHGSGSQYLEVVCRTGGSDARDAAGCQVM